MKKAQRFLCCPALLILLSVIAAQRVTIAAHKEVHSIPIIDTHIHLYDTARPQGLPWPPPTDKVLYRPVLPADFDKICRDNQIAATVIVEASEWLDDNQWVLDLVKHNPKRYIALVGSLEIGTPEFGAQFEKLSRDKRFVGLRLRERPRGEDFFNEEVWRDLKLMAELNQTLDVLMFSFSLNDIDMIAKKVPTLKILSNHVAGADIDGKAVDPTWAAALKRAAAHPNVYCKVSGLFQQSHQRPSPTNTDFYRPLLDELWKVFGEDRLVYGSNWPVTMHGGTYVAYKHIVLDYFTPKGTIALEKLLYRNAIKFYGLPDMKLGE